MGGLAWLCPPEDEVHHCPNQRQVPHEPTLGSTPVKLSLRGGATDSEGLAVSLPALFRQAAGPPARDKPSVAVALCRAVHPEHTPKGTLTKGPQRRDPADQTSSPCVMGLSISSIHSQACPASVC